MDVMGGVMYGKGYRGNIQTIDFSPKKAQGGMNTLALVSH